MTTKPPYDLVVKDQEPTNGIIKLNNTITTTAPTINNAGDLNMNGADITVNTLNYTSLNPPISGVGGNDTLHYGQYLGGSTKSQFSTPGILDLYDYEALALSSGHTVQVTGQVSNAPIVMPLEPTATTIFTTPATTQSSNGYIGYSARKDGFIESLVLNYADELTYQSVNPNNQLLTIIILHGSVPASNAGLYTTLTNNSPPVGIAPYTYYVYKEVIEIQAKISSRGVSGGLNLQDPIAFNTGDVIMLCVKQLPGISKTVHGHAHASLYLKYN